MLAGFVYKPVSCIDSLVLNVKGTISETKYNAQEPQWLDSSRTWLE